MQGTSEFSSLALDQRLCCPPKAKRKCFSFHSLIAILLLLDSTTVVSKMRAPPWTVGPGTTCIPSASLPDHASKCPPHYCIVGNGKTGIDAIVWLIERGTDPGQITWIVPRDSYMYNRAIGQVAQLKMSSLPFHLEAAKAVAEAEDVDEMWARLVESGYVRVLDPAHKPSTWHCPVVSDVEFECIRKVKDVVRLGHVKSIADDEMVLEKGSKKLPAGTIVVDCAAATLKGRPVVPVFQGNRIVLQPLFACQVSVLCSGARARF